MLNLISGVSIIGQIYRRNHLRNTTILFGRYLKKEEKNN